MCSFYINAETKAKVKLLPMGYARTPNLGLQYTHVECSSMCLHGRLWLTTRRVPSFLSQDLPKAWLGLDCVTR